MPAFEKHIAQAESNLGAAGLLLGQQKFPDWCITTCFYAVVHVVEAIVYREKPIAFQLSGRGDVRSSDEVLHIPQIKEFDRQETSNSRSTHWYRTQVVRLNPDLFGEAFAEAYLNLYELSHQARYDCYESCKDDLPLVLENMKEVCDQTNQRYKLALSVL